MKPLESSFDNLKDLIIVIMGIAIGYIMIQSFELMKNRDFNYLILGFSLTLLAIRFLHGNMRTLDETLDIKKPVYQITRMWRFIDFITIIIQGTIFTVIGATLDDQELLWLTLLILMLSDLILAITSFMTFEKISVERQRWLFINILSVIMLCAGKLFNLPFFQYFIATLIMSSFFDYLINLDFYFPHE